MFVLLLLLLLLLILLLLLSNPVTVKGRAMLFAPSGRFLDNEEPIPKPVPLPSIRRPSGPNDDMVLRRLPFNIIDRLDVVR